MSLSRNSRRRGRERKSALGALALIVVSICLAGPALAAGADQTIWRLGEVDDSAAEFGAKAIPAAIDAPQDWSSRSDWSAFPGGLKGDAEPSLDIRYRLPRIPANGVMFAVKLIDAPKSGAQVAVFSNAAMAGLLQFWGTSGTGSPYKWKKTYRLYIPKEMLVKGDNDLRLQTVRPMYSDSRVDPQVWCRWDYLSLTSLSQHAAEPIHGAMAYLGTTIKNNNYDFVLDDDDVKLARLVLPWLGIAYSGNTMRADFWYDVGPSQPARLAYLQALRDMNMTVCVDYISGGHFRNDAAGNMPAPMQDSLKRFLDQYGGLIQYYELGNEPCMFGGGLAEYLNTARCIDRLKPPTLALAAPGWAFGGGKGTPVNWDANVQNRRSVEQYCTVLNGHSYGYSYADTRGGSFVENLATCGGVEDGWPKEFITTETGTNNWHSEENSTHFPSTQPKIAAFDRILRAHIAVVDRTMQHALIFGDFGMFNKLQNRDDPTTLTAYPGPDGLDTRLKTFRRLALAYASHGAPLPYFIENHAELANKMAYVRAVDTSKIPPQRASRAVSNKILLNFVNFEEAPLTMHVRIRLPRSGAYPAERFGPGDTYPAAHSALTLRASPAVELTVPLGPGDSVQYILSPPAR